MQNGRRKRKGLRERKEGAPRASMQAGRCDKAIIDHVRVITSLIEGRKVSREEVLAMLERERKRQQGIPTEEKTDYPARELTEDSS